MVYNINVVEADCLKFCSKMNGKLCKHICKCACVYTYMNVYALPSKPKIN